MFIYEYLIAFKNRVFLNCCCASRRVTGAPGSSTRYRRKGGYRITQVLPDSTNDHNIEEATTYRPSASLNQRTPKRQRLETTEARLQFSAPPSHRHRPPRCTEVEDSGRAINLEGCAIGLSRAARFVRRENSPPGPMVRVHTEDCRSARPVRRS